jgi:hypothetical protein
MNKGNLQDFRTNVMQKRLFEDWDLYKSIGIKLRKMLYGLLFLQKKSEAAMPTNPNRNNNQQHYIIELSLVCLHKRGICSVPYI